jgi:hypothetical protein
MSLQHTAGDDVASVSYEHECTTSSTISSISLDTAMRSNSTRQRGYPVAVSVPCEATAVASVSTGNNSGDDGVVLGSPGRSSNGPIRRERGVAPVQGTRSAAHTPVVRPVLPVVGAVQQCLYGRLYAEYSPSSGCPVILTRIYGGTYNPLARCVEDSLNSFIDSSSLQTILLSARSKCATGKAIHLYSMDSPIVFNNYGYKGVYPLLNEALFTNNELLLNLLGDFLYYVIVAIQQCPVVEKTTLWRGMLLTESVLSPNYNTLQLLTWYGINSCSRKESVANEFTTVVEMTSTQTTEHSQRQGVLCRIENCAGHDTSRYSQFQGEGEVTLLPGTKLTVLEKLYPRGMTELKLVQVYNNDFIRPVQPRHCAGEAACSNDRYYNAYLVKICIAVAFVAVIGALIYY